MDPLKMYYDVFPCISYGKWWGFPASYLSLPEGIIPFFWEGGLLADEVSFPVMMKSFLIYVNLPTWGELWVQ